MTYVPWNDARFDRAAELQSRYGVIDLHVDSIIQQRLFGYDVLKRHRARKPGAPLFWHADFPRVQEARYNAMCMGVHYWPWESRKGWREASKQIDYLDEVVAAEPGFRRVNNPDEWSAAAEAGEIGVAPGVEGAHMLNGEIGLVSAMADRGVSYLTITHFSKNSAATPSMGRGSNEEDGLTDFGLKLVRELNRYGIAIDVAHVNNPGVMELVDASRAPVLATHSGAKGVHDVPRLLSDEALDAIADKNGAVGIIFAPGFLTGGNRADSSCVLDHIDYIAQRIGAEHVCLGSDFDGWLPAIPYDMKDCRDIVKITHGLIERGYTDEQIGGILYRNAVRVFEEAWSVRDKSARP